MKLIALLLSAVLMGGVVSNATASAPAPRAMAETGLGQYRVAEPFRYTEAVRRSVYVPARDGVRLAIDYYLPAVNGRAVSGKFPTLLEFTRYGRAVPRPDGGTMRWPDAPADRQGVLKIPANASGPLLFLAYGYAVAVADMRGAGASFGPSYNEGDGVEGRDGFDLVEWLGRQRWSNGAVGMFGASYLAEIQPRIAAERPRALKAMSMQVAFFDGANGAYSMGGIYRAGWLGAWSSRVAVNDNRSTTIQQRILNIAEVDADPEQTLLRQAIDEHRRGGDTDGYNSHFEEFKTLGVLRDRLTFLDQYQVQGQNNLQTIVDRVNRSGVPALLFGGWHDIYSNDMLYWYANLEVAKKMIYGPWAHGYLGPMPNDPRDRERQAIVSRETLRWFDRWLLGVRNDAETRAPIYYGLQRTRSQTDWYEAQQWPPKEVVSRDLFLSTQPAASVLSQNDGSLALAPQQQSQRQPWTVDYTTTTGTIGTRWLLRKVYEIDMASNDMKSLTFTSPPLARDLQVVGVPTVKLWLSSENAKDADVYAYLNAVNEDGESRLVAEGILRASHRKLGKAPYKNYDLPFPTSLSTDVKAAAPLSEQPVTLEFAMLSTGRVFHAGERLRLTIAGADRDNTVTIEQQPTPRLGIHVGGNAASALTLPVLGDAPQFVTP
ncbi:CocE/NonD family hydrolase [Steroidobacter sp.]|uniref:CocE/NonD family hydrolase n=1 Tax=Steroidobacter sp. TaxID=1978227 RepID=UPI001A522101|nr:CocE/NonD family hydrolase [Steroidobacter sp.]MBL8271381.1 CocE/NonD family hydrolase [Steroidobacter sp.]